ncbi:hypothetical protein SEA_IBANTIK_30 [Streptomyces phage Ibantik]|uniref:Uncharacterized protein n=1 Tax=Streptomyces phage Ibantik TaxID=2182397 RepID=A0A2U8UNE5_9CAUD|nr:hypothetical protein QEH36_gp030 [Streptomyces phage Ibantik]AWN05254.1 hypothetical protein SEA_IBANTIK_30 [Streptomyces phage Ibantik]
MARYAVPMQTYASIVVYVETDSTDPEEIVELAEYQLDVGSLCHQCASAVEVGDIWEPIKFDGKFEFYKEDE